jgi:hypothetical protein
MQVQRIPLTKPHVKYECIHKDDTQRLEVGLIDHDDNNYDLYYYYASRDNNARASYMVHFSGLSDTTSKFLLADNPHFKLKEDMQLKVWHMTLLIFTRCLDVHSVPLTQLVE